MPAHTVTVAWRRGDQPFVDQRYSRAHQWVFDGGVTVPASSSPHVVPPPCSEVGAVDPEEAFVASLCSCHMLWFLSIAAKRGYGVDSYTDQAAGVMGKNASGRLAMLRVTLRPRVAFFGDRRPTHAEVDSMHHEAHAECFIANSVTTEVRCEPVYVD